MLSIRRTRRSIHSWIDAWFGLLDSLFGVLTLDFWSLDIEGWWYFNLPLEIERHSYIGTRNQIKWWIVDWVMILESLFTILTLGYLCIDLSYRVANILTRSKDARYPQN